MELSMGERQAVTAKMAVPYRVGTRAEEGAILDQETSMETSASQITSRSQTNS
jgi:hypothetical protein